VHGDDGTSGGTFSSATFQPAGPVSVSELDFKTELCVDRNFGWRVHGSSDLGPTVLFEVGADSISLVRDPEWEPGELWYVDDSSRDVGTTVDAELHIQGAGSGVTIPPPIEITGSEFVDSLLRTGALEIDWVPDPNSVIVVSLVASNGVEHRPFVCRVDDDGHLSADTGWRDIATGWSVDINVRRTRTAVVEVDGIGAMYVDATTDRQYQRI
jgi:hypothetical protein